MVCKKVQFVRRTETRQNDAHHIGMKECANVCDMDPMRLKSCDDLLFKTVGQKYNGINASKAVGRGRRTRASVKNNAASASLSPRSA